MTAPRIPVTVLGATGAVGQKLVRLLSDHPWFTLASLCASERNVGRPYGEAVHWLESTPLPDAIGAMDLQRTKPGVAGVVAFSALDAEAATTIEPWFAEKGYWVVTNTRTFRMEPDVPLLIPEVNAGQLGILDRQRSVRSWAGGLVANPNCSAIVLASALAPLHAAFGVARVFVSTIQAVSGAGYPGVASLDILGNVIPYISGGEEAKIERETAKILAAHFPVSAHVHRAPVVDGHSLAISAGLRRVPGVDAVREALRTFRPPEEVRALPSAPDPFLFVHDAPDRPQPRLDAMLGGGMTVSVGRIRPCALLDVRMSALGHNTIRGAAGAAILNAELLVARGFVERPA